MSVSTQRPLPINYPWLIFTKHTRSWNNLPRGKMKPFYPQTLCSGNVAHIGPKKTITHQKMTGKGSYVEGKSLLPQFRKDDTNKLHPFFPVCHYELLAQLPLSTKNPRDLRGKMHQCPGNGWVTVHTVICLYSGRFFCMSIFRKKIYFTLTLPGKT